MTLNDISHRNREALSSLRDSLHACPERAFDETKTADILDTFLSGHVGDDDRFTVHRSWKTSLLIEYRGGADLPFDLFRSDMDALPVTEPPRSGRVVSKNPGMMHACGHDVHMTVLSGFVLSVAEMRPDRNILFVFQPAEEGAGGALGMFDAGVFDQYDIRHAFALHVTDDLKKGVVASNAATLFAMPRELDIVFTGRQAHGAMPQSGSDAIAAASLFLSEIKRQLSTELEPSRPVLFHAGRIHGGTARNIVAGECTLECTVRAPEKIAMEEAVTVIERTARQTAALNGGHVTVTGRGEYLPVINNPRLFDLLRQAGEPAGVTVRETGMKMVGEDFGFFTDRYPGLLFWLGAREETRPAASLHSPDFYPGSDVIPVGIKIFAALLELL